MSQFLNKAHLATVLLGTLAIDAGAGSQVATLDLQTPRMFDRFILRTTFDFEHGETAAQGQKFGGIYNIIQNARIEVNGADKRFMKTGRDLYVDGFKRDGREENNLNYSDLPERHIQNIEYCFSGAKSILGGIQVLDGVFALDLRHSEAGVNTFNSVQLILEIGTIHDVFDSVNSTAMTGLNIEVYGVELFHDEQSSKRLALDGKRYAEIVTKSENRKIADTALESVFNLALVGRTNQGVYLSDLTIYQVDADGRPIPFDDENAIVEVMIGDQDFCKMPIWQIRKMQSKARLQPVPPNILFVPLVQPQSGFGGLSPADLATGATLRIKANGENNETYLDLRKTYTYKV